MKKFFLVQPQQEIHKPTNHWFLVQKKQKLLELPQQPPVKINIPPRFVFKKL